MLLSSLYKIQNRVGKPHKYLKYLAVINTILLTKLKLDPENNFPNEKCTFFISKSDRIEAGEIEHLSPGVNPKHKAQPEHCLVWHKNKNRTPVLDVSIGHGGS